VNPSRSLWWPFANSNWNRHSASAVSFDFFHSGPSDADIVESILAGQAFADISLQHRRKGIPVFWEEQRGTLIAAD
jgi:hypothetical protein